MYRYIFCHCRSPEPDIHSIFVIFIPQALSRPRFNLIHLSYTVLTSTNQQGSPITLERIWMDWDWDGVMPRLITSRVYVCLYIYILYNIYLYIFIYISLYIYLSLYISISISICLSLYLYILHITTNISVRTRRHRHMARMQDARLGNGDGQGNGETGTALSGEAQPTWPTTHYLHACTRTHRAFLGFWLLGLGLELGC
jgi:hypothetical protein